MVQTQESLVDLTNPKIKYKFTLPALIVSIGFVLGTFWTLSQIFDGLPVDGGAPTLIEIPDLTGSDQAEALNDLCLLYTSPSPRDRTRSRMPSSA